MRGEERLMGRKVLVLGWREKRVGHLEGSRVQRLDV